MIQSPPNLWTLIFAVVTLSWIVSSGCKPATDAEIQAGRDVASSDSTAETTADANNQTELDGNGAPVIISGDLNSVNWRSLVGRDVTIAGDLVIVDTFDLARRGQVTVARQRLDVPTSQVDPNDADPNANSFEGGSNVANVTKAQNANDNATIVLDDVMSKQNVFPPPLFPELGNKGQTVRLGSVVQGVSGRLRKDRNKFLLVSKEPLQWTPSPRPERPDVGKADITIASFNVLNYFTTIDDGSNNARGADSVSELERQEAKIVSAIAGLNADVIGLMEMENNLAAEERLVAALNRGIGKEAYKGCGVPGGFRKAPGSRDAIRVGIIYRADRVSPVGDVSMIRDPSFFVARTPIVQTFTPADGGKPFTVVVNHFKSKGGSDDANTANKNKGDGQGAYNAARRAQALAICSFIDARKQDADQSRILVIGDLNAYEQEDPIDALRANGLVDLQERYGQRTSADAKPEAYSYVYYGQCGSLDHAFATEDLATDVTGIATWHINADEPRFIDYNEEFNPKPLYKANPYRSSDHDPVLIGIRK